MEKEREGKESGNNRGLIMPSAFSNAKHSNPHKQGSLQHDLWETRRDIRRTKRGIKGEASLDEMKDTKKRIKREINDIAIEEGKSEVDSAFSVEMMERSKFGKMPRYKKSKPANHEV